MKKNKLLLTLILLVLLSFSVVYSKFISEKFSTPITKKLAKTETISKDKVAVTKKAKAPNKVNKVAVAGVTITNAVAVNGGGSAAPGSLLDFTITISNSGTDATGTTFQDIIENNLTLVPNSLKATPIAVNDTYNCIGNVGITVNTAGGVLSNDVSPDATILTATLLASPTNGTLTLAANGSFTYNPNAGYAGTDTFTYNATSTTGKINTATVSVVVSAPIYFINSSVATNGNGTLASPFKTVDNASSATTGSIFIYTGTGSSGTTLTLADNQKLIGQGATASLTTILGLSVPTYSNTLPSTGGTNPNFAVLNLKLNNDVEGITLNGTSATMAGPSVGTLKVRDVTITGGTAVPVNIAAGGALDCVFKSISANGASKGISVSSATGSFQVTGTGSTAGSGGTIQNIANRGAEFISCTNVTLKNMNFTNASTSTSICSTPGADNSSCNGAIHLKSVTGVTLDNIAITGTTNAMGININNVSGFALSNSTLTGCGSANGGNSDVGGIYALNLSGTSSITNTNVNDSWGRGFYCYNGIGLNPPLTMTVTGCQFKNSFNKSNGASNFTFQGYNTSNNTLTLKSNDFSNPKTDGLTLNFGGTSTNTIQVGGTTLSDGNTINAAASSPGSNGLSLQATAGATVNYNVIYNTFKASYNGSFPCNIGNQGTGTMNGRINFNTIDGGGNTGAVSSGISVAAYGASKHIAEIKGNVITNVTNYGIVSEANDNGVAGTARMDATIKDNTITLLTNGYAHVGVIAVGNDASSTLKSVANIGNNTTNSPVTGLATGTLDVLAQGTNSQVILQGATPYVSGTGDRSAALTTFWNANNVGTRTAFDEQGGGTILSGTALVPSNPAALKLAAPKVATPAATPVLDATTVTATSTTKSTNTSLAKIATNTISVGPFTLASGKSTVITFSATINAAATLPANTCQVTNQASVSGTNFSTVNSNTTTTSIKPANATFTNTTENISCLGSTAVSLNATCPLGTTATWYTTLSGGTSFATGSAATATPVANNTTYCVACEAAYCASDRLLVKTVTGTASTSSTETVSACDSYLWAENGLTYTISGTYTKITGCDTKTLNLTISNSSAIANTVSVNSNVLTADQSGATYQWYKCPNTLLTNETNQTFTPSANGDYKVVITMGICSKTSNCITVGTLAVAEFASNEFKIYPNPSKGILNIVSPYQGNFSIVDVSGKTLKSFQLEENIATAINLENLTDGIYYIKSNGNAAVKTQKIIIKK